MKNLISSTVSFEIWRIKKKKENKELSDKIARQIQKSYTAEEQKRKVHKLGTICVQNGIDEIDLFNFIRNKRAVEDFDWTS